MMKVLLLLLLLLMTCTFDILIRNTGFVYQPQKLLPIEDAPRFLSLSLSLSLNLVIRVNVTTRIYLRFQLSNLHYRHKNCVLYIIPLYLPS